MQPQRSGAERGAALVEMAMVMPLLALLLLGIIEFGFLFGQFNEVRHAAREGARYAAVSRPDRDGGGVGNSDVIDAVCDALDLPGVTIQVSLDWTDADSDGNPDRLEEATLTVVADTDSLSGAPLISSFLPNQLENEATFRLEQDGKWTAFTNQSCP